MNKYLKLGTLVCLCSLFLLSCDNNQQDKNRASESATKQMDYALIGKKGIITFPEMKAEVNYTSDTTLHWKTTDQKGEVLEGDEAISYKKLTDHLHFLNWIEKDGWTVSQIINTKDGEVKAYWSFKDEKSARGKRSSQFVDATFGYAK
jgi:hypothetical protein